MKPKEDVHCVVRIHARAKNKTRDAKEKMGVWNIKKEVKKRKMETKIVGTLVIAGLIVMAVFVGTAAADGYADIFASSTLYSIEYRDNFVTAENVYGWGYLGPESDPGDMGGRIYVVNHSDTWINGTLLDDVSGGYETVSWGASGNFYRLAWPTTLDPGTYDLILDLDVTGRNGVWTNISQDDLTGVHMPLGYIVDPIWTFNVTGEPEPTPTIESSDSLGNIKDTFYPGESVYAYGSGYGADKTYDLYVVNDTTWFDGMAIPGRVSGTETTVTTDSDGKISPHPTSIWASSVVGRYDIVVDVNGNGYYNASIDALDDMDVNGAGFEVIPEFSTIAIPVVSILGLLFLFNYRKQRRNE